MFQRLEEAFIQFVVIAQPLLFLCVETVEQLCKDATGVSRACLGSAVGIIVYRLAPSGRSLPPAPSGGIQLRFLQITDECRKNSAHDTQTCTALIMVTLFVSFMSTQCALHIGTRYAQLFQVPPPHPPPLVTVRLCQSTDSCEPRDALSCTDSPPLAARCRRLPLEASNCGFDKLLMSAEKRVRTTHRHALD